MQSLATKYRPTNLDDVIGQDSIVKILKKQIELKDFKNCYLFNGSSGCGKTTCARILANEINEHCGSPIEIDAASNNGVDNVKDLVKSASERSLDSKYKIIIMDECHSLTSQAWQAFLKCIEEPPAYTIFIFCTTEKNKVPDTIKNRCQVFNFNRVRPIEIEKRLLQICKNENCTNFEESCNYISKISNGQVRDAIANLEKCISLNHNLSMENILSCLGDYSYDVYFSLIDSMLDGKVESLYTIIEDIYNNGSDLRLFVEKFLDFCVDLSKYCIFKDICITKIPNVLENRLKSCTLFEGSIKYYNYYTEELLKLKNMLKNDTNPLSTIEVIFCKLARLE